MSPSRLRLVGGTIYDPANQVDGEARDLCIEDGRIVASLPDGAPTPGRKRNGRDAWRGGHSLPPGELKL